MSGSLAGIGGAGASSPPVDNLTSTSSSLALSAKQGKVLSEALAAKLSATVQTAFSTAIPLDIAGEGRAMPMDPTVPQTIDAPTTFSKSSGAIPNGSCEVAIKVGPSAPAIDFGPFTPIGNDYVATADRLYLLTFGAKVGRDLVVVQALDAAISSGGGDASAPTIASATVAEADPAKLHLTVSEEIDLTHLHAAQFAVSGSTVTAIAAIDSTHVDLTLSSSIANGATPTLSATQNSTDDLRDVAGNKLANFTGFAITNNRLQPGRRDNLLRTGALGQPSDFAVTGDPYIVLFGNPQTVNGAMNTDGNPYGVVRTWTGPNIKVRGKYFGANNGYLILRSQATSGNLLGLFLNNDNSVDLWAWINSNYTAIQAGIITGYVRDGTRLIEANCNGTTITVNSYHADGTLDQTGTKTGVTQFASEVHAGWQASSGCQWSEIEIVAAT